MSLATYRRKRHFSSTPEPQGKTGRRREGRSYVIHKHRARSLHYDLRLELDAVLKSWAVPKGPSLDPRDKRLAIQVEDHPLDYGSFEGDIPAGEYGAGEVIIWDRGTWEPLDDPHEGLRQGKLEFEIRGEKLHGAWVLVASPPGRSRQPQWFLIKVKDAEARPRDKVDVVEQFPGSVASGRTIDDTAVSASASKSLFAGAQGRATGAVRRRGRGRQTRARLKTVSGAKAANMPRSVELQLATLVSQPPPGDEWLSEIKLDGYRIACHVADGKARLYSRRQQDWTARFAAIASSASELPVDQAVLDGEVVVFLPDGRTSFQALQNAVSEDRTASLAYVVFDLLYLDGYDLRGAAIEDRKRVLSDLLMSQKNPRVQYLEHVFGQADRFYEECCKRKLEGIICKRRARPYVAGRGLDWLKARCLLRQEFVIGGYTDSTNRRRPFGALLVGYYDQPGRLTYAGRVGTGWNERTMAELSTQLKRHRQDKPPFASPVEGPRKTIHWVRPPGVGSAGNGTGGAANASSGL
jgi:bifunctional non-homologous end joining protein LigD